jgi:hypothetical protein
MTELLAIVRIVSGAAVAITVPFINARLERSRLEQQSRDARAEELRALLDGAVQHLWKTWTILYEVSEEGRRDLPRPQWSDRRLRQLGDEAIGRFMGEIRAFVGVVEAAAAAPPGH